MNFKKIAPNAINDNTFKLIGEDWMLVTAADPEGDLICGKDYNTMTASWGGVGVLWNKPVAFVFIRPQRHTFTFTERNDTMTLSFFGEEYRRALSFCGSKSGREYDKAKECGLTPVCEAENDGRNVYFEEARLVLKVRPLYKEYLNKDAFLSEEPLKNYAAGDFHMMYICEITDALVRE
ncbi:MAG: flavin reductase family protein [Ruminococcaceae bacterium]|nr:flavin reductase family protein [Oscillospiraceae bacterium]